MIRVFISELRLGDTACDGPGGEDGELHLRGVWFAITNEATGFEVTGELGGRAVSVRVPAT